MLINIYYNKPFFGNHIWQIILITGILIDDKIRQRCVSLLQTGGPEIGPKLLELLSRFDKFNQDLSLCQLPRVKTRGL